MVGRSSSPDSPDTVVLIHGLYLTSLSWEKFAQRYAERGLRVIAPDWPGMVVGVEQLRRDPSPLAELTVSKIVDHYDRIIRELDTPPIIVGHSFGGIFMQLLLDRGLGAAGVGISAGPVRGVLRLPIVTIRSNWAVLRNPANRRRAVPVTKSDFHFAFGNLLTREESDKLYERYCVPAAGGILWEGALANVNPNTAVRVDFKKPDRAPMLFLAAGKDHVLPPSVNKATRARYRNSEAITSYKEYPDRSHASMLQDGWESVADYALDWALEHAAAAATRLRPVDEMPRPMRTA